MFNLVHIPTVAVSLVALVGLGLSGSETIKSYVTCVKEDLAGCETEHRHLLWFLILEALVLLGYLLQQGLGMAKNMHYSLMGFLVLTGVEMMGYAQKTLSGDSGIQGDKSEDIAAAGFVLLAVLNVGLILWPGVSRAKGSSSAMRFHREYSPARFGLLLLLLFCAVLGSFMVGATAYEQRRNCGHDDKCIEGLDLGHKWFGGAFTVAVLLCVAISEGFGILENLGSTLAAFVTVAAAVNMNLTHTVLDGTDTTTSRSIQVAGYIALAVTCLALVIILGCVSTPARETGAETPPWLEDVRKAFYYSLLPYLLSWALAVAGVAIHAKPHAGGHEDKGFTGSRLTYWTLAFALAGVIVAVVGKATNCGKLMVPSILLIVLATLDQMEVAKELMPQNCLYLSLAAAGFIVMTAMNFIFIVLLGLEEGAGAWPGFSVIDE